MHAFVDRKNETHQVPRLARLRINRMRTVLPRELIPQRVEIRRCRSIGVDSSHVDESADDGRDGGGEDEEVQVEPAGPAVNLVVAVDPVLVLDEVVYTPDRVGRMQRRGVMRAKVADEVGSRFGKEGVVVGARIICHRVQIELRVGLRSRRREDLLDRVNADLAAVFLDVDPNRLQLGVPNALLETRIARLPHRLNRRKVSGVVKEGEGCSVRRGVPQSKVGDPDRFETLLLASGQGELLALHLELGEKPEDARLDLEPDCEEGLDSPQAATRARRAYSRR